MPAQQLPGITKDRRLVGARLELVQRDPADGGGIQATLVIRWEHTDWFTVESQTYVGLEADLLPVLGEDFASSFIVCETAQQMRGVYTTNRKLARHHRKRYDRA